MSELEARLRRLEDRAEIEDLIVTYFFTSDSNDIAGLAQTFAPNGVFAVSGQTCGSSRDDIASFMASERAKMGLTNHVLDAALIRLEAEDSATGTVAAHLELVYEGVALFGAVKYSDSYRKLDGRWKIERRDMRTLYLAPWKEAGEALNSDDPVRWPGQPAQPNDFPRHGD